MMALELAQSWFVKIWVAGLVAVNAAILTSTFSKGPTFWFGLTRVFRIYNPRHPMTLFVEAVSIFVPVAAIAWRDVARQRKL